MCFAQNFQPSLLSSPLAPNICQNSSPFCWFPGAGQIFLALIGTCWSLFRFSFFPCSAKQLFPCLRLAKVAVFWSLSFSMLFPKWKQHMKLTRKLRPGQRRSGWVHRRRRGSCGLGLKSLNLRPPSSNFNVGLTIGPISMQFTNWPKFYSRRICCSWT